MKQQVGNDTVYETVSSDIRWDEDYSPEAIYGREKSAARQKYVDAGLYEPTPGMVPDPLANSGGLWMDGSERQDPLMSSVKRIASLERKGHIDALTMIYQQRPESLDQFPGLKKALAQTQVLSVQDARNLINMSAMEDAFQKFVYTEDPQTQANVILSMNPVQRAAFGEFFDTRLQQLIKDTASDPNSAMNGLAWVWDKTLGPVTDFLWAANRLAYHTFTAGLYGLTKSGDIAKKDLGAFEELGYVWDMTSTGKYDQEQIQQLSDKYGAYRVNVILDLSKEQELGIGEDGSTPYQRWLDKYQNDPQAWQIIRGLTDATQADPELTEIALGVEMAATSNPGQLIVSNLLPGFRTSQGAVTAASALNFGTAFVVDPTLYAGKIGRAARMFRYSLNKIDPAIGTINTVDSAAKVLRRPQFGIVMAQLIKDFAKVREIKAAEAAGKAKPGAAAAARAAVSRNYGKKFDEDILVEMETWNGHGLRDMDDAALWIYENSAAPRILAGSPAAKYSTVAEALDDPLVSLVDDLGMPANSWMARGQRPLFERLQTTQANMQTRGAVLPTLSNSMATLPIAFARNRFRMAMATRNPVDNAGRKTVRDIFPNTSSSKVAETVSDNPGLLGAAEGVERRNIFDPISWLSMSGNGPAAFRYTQRAISARVDRFMRLGARKPNGDTIYVGSARDTKQVYELARAFFTKYTAQTIAQAFREGTIAERRLIVNGLINSIHEARGINSARIARFQKDAQDGIKIARAVGVTGSQLGERFSPTIKRTDGIPDTAGSAANPFLVSKKSWTENPSKWVSDDGLKVREHALHMWQTSDYVRLPDYAAIDKVSQKAGVWWTLFGWTTRPVAQFLTDGWSLGTLAGPRFVARNAIEDYTMWWVTQGRWSDFALGRRGSTLVRAARGDQDKQGFSGKVKSKSRLGVINRKLGRTSDPGFGNATIFRFVREYMSDAEWEAYKAAVIAGRTDEMGTLLGTAWARGVAGKLKYGKVNLRGTGMSPRQAAAAAWMTTHTRLLDDISEEAMNLNSASSVSLADRLAEKAVGGAYVDGKVRYALDEWEDVSGAGEASLRYYLGWHRDITGIVKTDGEIGRIAILNLQRIAANPAERDAVVREIVQAIINDTKFGYKERFSAIYEKTATIEDFANRYLASVQNTFAKADGKLNTNLWNTVVRREKGKPVDIDLDGLTFDDLRSYSEADRPAYVNAQSYSPVPVMTNLNAMDRIWEVMGQQYARISKEPIFMANVLRIAEDLDPYYNWLKGIIGEKAANTRVNQLAVDRAFGLTMSYVDNPANRTLFAWNMRNVSRYYRATEDFVRRMTRVASNYPTGLWKVGLTYHALDDTGFVYTDQYGDKYFMYPGTGFLGDTLRNVFGIMGGTLPLSPFSIGGKLKMLSPSTDPNQLIPGLSGPLLSFPLATLFGLFPQVSGVQSVMTGEYSVNQSAWKQVLPAGVTRALTGFSQDDRDSIYANAVMGATAIAIAAGLGPKSSSDVTQINDFTKAVGDIALQVVVMKTILGYIVPASPQIYMDDVTTIARQSGVVGMRQAFLDLLQSQGDSPTAFVDAMVKWVEIFGPQATAYTESKSKPVNDLGGNLYTATTNAVSSETFKFVRDNQELVERFPVASTYLFPRGEDFSFTMWNWYDQNGYKESRDIDEFTRAALGAEGRFQRDERDRVIDKMVLDFQLAGDEASAKYYDNEYRSLARNDLRGQYPWLTENDLNQNPLKYATEMNKLLNGNGGEEGELRQMIAWYKRPDATEPVPASIKQIDLAIRVFDRWTTGREDENGPAGFRNIEGQTDAAVALRKQIREQLVIRLTEIGETDPQATLVVKQILVPLVNARSILGSE